MAEKLRIGQEGLIKILIDKMLENHDVGYDYVIKNPEIEGKLWCSNYKWTQEESDNYKKWFIEFFQKNVTPRLSKKYLDSQYAYFNLQFGLNIDNE